MTVELAGKILVGATVALWGVAGTFARMMDTREDVANLTVDVKHHAMQAGHPVGLERLDTVLSEQKELRRDVVDQGKQLAAICQATGADCR